MENKTVKALPRLGFGEAVNKALANVTNFNGRARRSEYWWTALAVVIVSFILNIIFSSMPTVSNVISVLLGLLTLSLTVRRLHDTGHGGWMPVVNFLLGVYMIVYMQVSGFYELTTSVNPDVDATMEILTSPCFWLPTLVAAILGIIIFIYSLCDSHKGDNKYGPSPKYVDNALEKE